MVPRRQIAAAIAVAATLAGLAACGGGSDDRSNQPATDPELAAVEEIVERRCFACHSTEPTEYGYKTGAAGLEFDKPGVIESAAAKIYERVVVRADMPLLNETGMTLAERNEIAVWFRRLSGEDEGQGPTGPTAMAR